jgi:hypothetical protein
MPRAFILAATCVAVFASTGVAQNGTPEELAAQIWSAVQAHDWERMASLTHPVALHQLRELLEPLVMMNGVEADSARQTIFGAVSRNAAAAASDSVVYVNLMRFSASVKADLPGAVEATRYQPLGSVYEGADTIHVIGRASATVSGRPLSWIQVTSLMRSGSTWRGLLEPNWSQFAWALRAAVARRQ